MKDFNLIVDEIVKNWKQKEILLLKEGGLVGVSKRRQGDIAEDFVVSLAEDLPYFRTIEKSKGSKSPADVYSLYRRPDFWHLMLIQVKSSVNKDKIHLLNKDEIKEMKELVKVARITINNSDEAKIFWDKSFIISAGYAGVWRIEAENFTRHKLIHTDLFEAKRLNKIEIDEDSAMTAISKAHLL
jgi:hypothetical protein